MVVWRRVFSLEACEVDMADALEYKVVTRRFMSNLQECQLQQSVVHKGATLHYA